MHKTSPYRTWLSVAALMSVFLGGCAADIVTIGPDTYMIADDSALVSQSSLRTKLIQRAAKFCTEQNKGIVVDSQEGAAHPYYTEANVSFMCLDRNDPEYRRPKLRAGPDVIIQDNR